MFTPMFQTAQILIKLILLRIYPRLINGNTDAYSTAAAPIATFTGPIDNASFDLHRLPCLGRADRIFAFVKISTTVPNDPPTPVQPSCTFDSHVLLIFPVTHEPWRSSCQWSESSEGAPLHAPHWITGTGAIVGRLKSELKDAIQFDNMKNIIVIVLYE